jgi:dihydroorotase
MRGTKMGRENFMLKQGDLLIRGGTVVDPSNNFIGKRNILVCDNKIVDIAEDDEFQVEETIEAEGYIVTPGLIDNHTHLYEGGTEIGLTPDLSLLPMGVTTAVDAGSAGAATLEAFMQCVILRSKMRIFCNINVSSMGQITENCPEEIDPKNYNVSRLKYLMDKFPRHIRGLKIRCDKVVVKEFGMEPLKAAIHLGNELDCRVVVHTTNPPAEISDIADILRAGDIFCHCYHGQGNNIIDEQGKVKDRIWKARQRGVLFDSADARGNHVYRVIKPAIAQGFTPDIISTDLTQGSLFGKMLYGLPLVLSKYLSLGLDILEVIRGCTTVPAQILGMDGKIGTLSAGALADIAIFKLEKRKITFTNRANETYEGSKLLLPKTTILNGKIVYRQLDTMI